MLLQITTYCLMAPSSPFLINFRRIELISLAVSRMCVEDGQGKYLSKEGKSYQRKENTQKKRIF